MVKSNILKLVCLTVIALGVVSCSDNSVGPDAAESEPPELPSLQQYQPQTEYFSANTQQKSTQAGTGYKLAAQLMRYTVDPLFASTQVYLPFFSQAKQAEPSLNDGVWEWTYSYSQYEQSAEIRLTAETEGTDKFAWNLFISSSNTGGQNFEDYRFMDGSTSTDGSDGNWSIYPYEPGGNASAIVSFDWDREDDEHYTASYNIESPESSATFTIMYSVAEAEHTLELSSSDGEYDAVVFWDSEGGTGYINPGYGDKTCWDAEYNNIACQ